MRKFTLITILLYSLFVISCNSKNTEHSHDDHNHSHSHTNDVEKHSPISGEHGGHVHETEEHDHEHEDIHKSDEHTCIDKVHVHEIEEHNHEHEENDHSTESHNKNIKTKIVLPEKFTTTINTTGTIKVLPTSEIIITAKTSGIIKFQHNNLVLGSLIKKDLILFTISGEKMANDNINLQFIKAKNKYLQSKENFSRAKTLISENIISQKEFLNRKLTYESDSTSYFILNENFSSRALQIKSPGNGKLFQLFVKNGEYVNSGQQLAIISKSCHNFLQVDLPKKYFTKISKINSGRFRMEYNDRLYSFDHDAKISTGNRIIKGNPFIPINFSLAHNHDLIPGSFAEVWLDIEKSDNSIIVPKSAIIEQQGLYFVFVKHGEDDYEKTQVTIDEINAENVKIGSGIHFNNEVVIQGVMELKLSNPNTSGIDSHYGHNH